MKRRPPTAEGVIVRDLFSLANVKTRLFLCVYSRF
ncbi:hypothetical protein EVA_08062 [gut metagenome]|uniref:Uncharacterized protein n=1 Tax=gut metagenome TaxID=749906 RepID=J9GND4_9ZZZZ